MGVNTAKQRTRKDAKCPTTTLAIVSIRRPFKIKTPHNAADTHDEPMQEHHDDGGLPEANGVDQNTRATARDEPSRPRQGRPQPRHTAMGVSLVREPSSPETIGQLGETLPLGQ